MMEMQSDAAETRNLNSDLVLQLSHKDCRAFFKKVYFTWKSILLVTVGVGISYSNVIAFSNNKWSDESQVLLLFNLLIVMNKMKLH